MFVAHYTDGRARSAVRQSKISRACADRGRSGRQVGRQIEKGGERKRKRGSRKVGEANGGLLDALIISVPRPLADSLTLFDPPAPSLILHPAPNPFSLYLPFASREPRVYRVFREYPDSKINDNVKLDHKVAKGILEIKNRD